MVLNGQIVARDTDIHCIWRAPALSPLFSLILRAIVSDNFETGEKLFEL